MKQMAFACAILLPLTFWEAASADDGTIATGATATLRRYCLDCHGKELAEARINLDEMTEQPNLGRVFKEWEKVIGMLRQSKMPPKESPQPSQSERTAALKAIEQALTSYIDRNAGDPGTVVLRRLTSAEFDYTIED